jgi:hypothetical protein
MNGAWIGSYRGTYHVREGREDELTRDEVKRYLKTKENLDLEIREDGTFSHKKVTEGTWTLEADRIRFQPTAFGGKTHDEMRTASEDAGRVFTLGFLFEPFELVLDGETLVTPDPKSLIYTVYRRV